MMLAYNVTAEDLDKALATINAEKYGGNICFKRGPEPRGNALSFTITVNDSSGAGAKYNQVSGRRVAAACWHAHGDLFDEIIRRVPEARIKTAISTVTAEGGNWVDVPATGPYYGPIYASEMCHCN